MHNVGYACAQMRSNNWDNIRYVLAVAQAGGLARAARVLGVNHATVLRHVTAFEARHDTVMFYRRASGYELTQEGRHVLGALSAVEHAVAEVERKVAGQGQGLAGRLRITITDSTFNGALARHMSGFRRAYPLIVLDLQVTYAALDLSARDADVAVRSSRSPPEELVGSRVASIGFGIYGSRQLANAFRQAPLDDMPWLGLGEGLSRSLPAQWMREHVSDAETVSRADSFLSLREMALSGLGVTLLPCCIADDVEGLTRVRGPIAELETGLWLLTHPDLRTSSLVRAFLDFFSAELRENAARLAGIGSA